MNADDDLLRRNIISAASRDGLTVEVNGQNQLRSWDSITSVGATIVSHGEAKIFVMAIALDDVRTFVVGEIEPAWPLLIALLHVCLPEVEPFSSWGPRLLAEPGVVDLFERSGALAG